MKILILTPSIDSPGGAERVLTLLANYWKQEHEIIFVTLGGSKDFYKLNYNIKRINLQLGAISTNKIIKLLKLPFIEIQRFKKVKDVLINERPDVLLSFLFITNIIGVLTGKKLKIPIILSERSDPHIYPYWKKLVMKVIYPMASGFVCQSSYMKKYTSKHYGNKIIEVIPNPLTKKQLDSNNSPKNNIIISIGRLIPEKNHIMTIEAFSHISKKFRNYKLLIFGEGPQREQLQQLINEKDISDRVELRGIEEDVTVKYSSSQLFVLSSNVEGYPNALIESMANGILSVSTDFPSKAAREIIHNGENGFLIPVNDVNKLTSIIDNVLSNPNKYKTIAKNGQMVSSTLSLDKISNKWTDLFLKVLVHYDK